ncbi:MAG: hypothetical protein UDK37_04565 [Holdemanella biformis]|nr:hypothetical protein [Holdemanella biformis]MEE0473148.1 hypothetical protein [Holdemanella biformis]
MIKLKNGYGIVSDGKSYTIVQDAIQKSKDGVETEIKKQISFYSTLEGALQGYSNCRMADLVSNFDMDLKDVKKAINELKEELKAYE